VSSNSRQTRFTASIAVGDDLAWGTHICHFYETRRDLLDLTLPYFETGLQRGERCVWIVSGSLTVDAATVALRREISDADQHLAAGRLEVVSHTDWYLQGGAFDVRGSTERWRAAVAETLDRGHPGLRVSANEAWLTEEVRADFVAYENGLSAAIAGQRLVAPSAPIQADTRSAEGNLRFLVQGDGRRRVQRDAVPDQLGAPVIDAQAPRKCTRGIRALDLEPQRPVEGGGQAQVVQDRRHSQDFLVVRRPLLSREAHREEPGAHDVVEEVGLGVLARILDGA